jgi:hypothetical protein
LRAQYGSAAGDSTEKLNHRRSIRTGMWCSRAVVPPASWPASSRSVSWSHAAIITGVPNLIAGGRQNARPHGVAADLHRRAVGAVLVRGAWKWRSAKLRDKLKAPLRS